jgi:hypothetical protein
MKCLVCSAEISWADCDKQHEDCYQTECDNPLGCGDISRDCEDLVDIGRWENTKKERQTQ